MMIVTPRALVAALLLLVLLCTLMLYPRYSTQYSATELPATSCGALREEFCISLRRYHEGDGVIWFQHLHKAGGTIMCRMALANVAVGFHRNCNPVNESNDLYPFWTATAAEQRKMALESRSKLIANERWMARERVPPGDVFTYITLIRDPLDRWLSNAYFEKQKKSRYSDSELLRIMARTAGYFADNLAVRAFAGKPEGPLGLEDLEFSKSVLRDFTIVAPTELYPLARVLLQEFLGWNWTTLHLHETTHRIRTGNVRASDAREELPPALLDRLKQREWLDMELYDFATRLFLDQLAAWGRSPQASLRFGSETSRSKVGGHRLIGGDFTALWMTFLRSNDVPRDKYKSAISPLVMGEAKLLDGVEVVP